MTATSYSCSQAELYVGCRIGWGQCLTYLPEFSDLKAKYTEDFINGKLDAINAADALFDADARYAETENMRKDLIELKDKVLLMYGKLLAYIDDAFQTSKWKTEYKAAGQAYYADAAKCKWTSVTALLSSAIPYIDKNKVALMENQNMPASFEAAFQESKTAFDTLYQSYLTATKDAAAQTKTKIEANNEIFESLRAMLSDAKRIFKNDTALAEKFTIPSIFAQTRGVKSSGILGRVNTGKKTKGIEKAKITLNDGLMVAISDKDGRFEFAPLPPGKYKVVVEMEGFDTFTIKDYKVRLGITSRLQAAMTAVTTAVPELVNA